MKSQKSRFPGFFLLGLIFTASLLSGRTWTTKEGSRSTGDLLSVEQDQVTLSINGREYIFPLSRFSSGDRAYIMKWKSEERCGVCKKKVDADKKALKEYEVFNKTQKINSDFEKVVKGLVGSG